jgi:hypothetical protein
MTFLTAITRWQSFVGTRHVNPPYCLSAMYLHFFCVSQLLSGIAGLAGRARF